MNSSPASSPALRSTSWLLFGVGTAFCWMCAWVESRMPLVSADVFMGALVYALAWLLIAALIRGRKKNRDYNAVARWYFWIALIGSGIMLGLPHVR